MKNLNPSNSNYLLDSPHDVNFQELKEWQSDLQFYLLEIKFFNRLLDKTFLHVTSKDETEHLRIARQVKNVLDVKCNNLLEKINKFEIKLDRFAESTVLPADEILINEYNELKFRVGNFIKEIKLFKSELFETVGEIIHISKMVSKEFEEGSITL